MGGRATVIIALAGGLVACGGKSGPATTTRAPAPNKEPQPVAQQPAPQPPPPCPDVTATLRAQSKEEIPDDFEVVVRDCVPGHFGGQVGFLVFGSIGPDDGPDSQSEEGWALYTFVVDAHGTVLAAAPIGGASWMNGIPKPTFQLADLDGDGTDEIIEVANEALADPSVVPKLLTVYRRSGTELKQILLLALDHRPAEVVEGDGPPCKASFQIIDGGLRVTAHAPYDPSAYDETPYWIGDHLIDALHTDPEDGTEDARCLADGVYTYRLTAGAFEVSRAASK